MLPFGRELYARAMPEPSVMNISPLGADAMSVGRLNGAPPCVTFFMRPR